MMRRASLKINAASSWIALAVNIAIGFVLTPFIVRSLGRTNYGIWTLVGSFVGYYGLLNLGVGSAMTRYVARYTAQKNSKALNEVASTALTIFSITGALVIILSFTLASVLADFFRVGETERAAFVMLVRILGVTTGISFPGNVFGSIVTAREHYVARNIVVIVQELLRAGLTVLFVVAGWGLVGIGLALLAGVILAIVCNVILFRAFASDIQLRPANARMQTLGMLLLYGGVTTVIAIADIMRNNLDSFVIAKWIGLSSVGVYGIAAAIGGYIVRLVVTGMGVLTPRFAAADGRGDREELQRLLVKALGLSSFISFGACMAAIVFGRQFILWWVGKDFADAVVVLWILATGSAFALAQNPAIGFMYALNRHHFYAIATIIEAIANLTLSIILVRRYGIVGVALGTLVPMLIIKIVVMPVYVSTIAGVSLRRYITPMLPAALVATAVFLAAYHLGIVTREATGLYDMLSVGVVTAVIYVVAWVVMVRVFNPGLLASIIPRWVASGGKLLVGEKVV